MNRSVSIYIVSIILLFLIAIEQILKSVLKQLLTEQFLIGVGGIHSAILGRVSAGLGVSRVAIDADRIMLQLFYVRAVLGQRSFFK